MPTAYRAPECGIKPGHFKVSSGASYLKTGIETEVPENQRALLESGREGAARGHAAERPGQEPGGLVLPGPDLSAAGRPLSAPTPRSPRPAQLAPDCEKEIDGYRQNAWVALVKGGSELRGAEEPRLRAGALPAGRLIYPQVADPLLPAPRSCSTTRARPTVPRRTSARRSAPAANATDTTELKIRNRSAFNQGAMLLNGQKYPEAAARPSSSTSSGCRTTPRPSAAWPRPTAARARRTRRRRSRSRSWRPAARAGAAAAGAGGGQRRT